MLLRLLADPAVTTVRSVARRPLDAPPRGGPPRGGPPRGGRRPLDDPPQGGPARGGHPKLVHTQADLRDDTAREALAGVDVLFHLGFALWRGADASLVNLDGTRNVLAARPARVVLASSAAVYGAWPDNPLPLGEDDWPRPNPQCRYAADKLRTERLCAAASPTLALRISAVLGAHADPRVARAVQGYRLGVPAFWGKNEALQFLDEADAAAALHCAGASSATGVVNIAPADWLTAKAVARVAGSRVVRLPERVLLGASDAAWRLHLSPFGADRAILINGPLALDPTRAARVLGWKATRTSAEVLTAALGAMARPPDVSHSECL